MNVEGKRGYPHDLAAHVRARWPENGRRLPTNLELLLDILYHASFLRDEERPVVCRILVAAPADVPAGQGPPTGLLALSFDQTQPCDEHTLRRLAPAADATRAFIAVHEAPSGLHVWGIVQTGPRWLHVFQGGRTDEPPVPAVLAVRIMRPGHLLVSCGSRLVAELRGGKLSDVRLDVFKSRWMPGRFREARHLMAVEHRAEARPALDEDSAAALTGYLAQQMLKRIIATMRSAHHGGTVVIAASADLTDQHLHARHCFVDDPARRHFRTLCLSILAILAHAPSESSPIETYRSSSDRRIVELDEGLFEVGHLIAALAAMDGAVVLTKRFEILGFGAEIAGALPTVDSVRRASDLEADRYREEAIDGVGTRHRSAYRLCAASPDTIAIVVSQDGGVRFVANEKGAVTYWEHGLAAE